MNKRGFKMKPEELQAWMAIRKKCHTHDNENKKAYTRKQKHKKEWAQGGRFSPAKTRITIIPHSAHFVNRKFTQSFYFKNPKICIFLLIAFLKNIC